MSVLLAAVWLLPVTADARRHRRPMFRVLRWSGEVGSDVEFRRDLRKATGQDRKQQDELLFTENVSLGALGWVYHPALMTFDSKIDVEMRQDSSRTKPNGRSESVQGNVLGYDMNLLMFPYKSYPINLFAGQTQTTVRSPLAPTRTLTGRRWGAGLSLRALAAMGREIPTRFTFRHQDTNTSGDLGNDQNRDEFELVMDNEGERTRNRLDYDWDRTQSSSGSTKVETGRQQFRLQQDRDLDRGQIQSRLLLSNLFGDLDSKSLAWNESVNLQHRPWLSSSYTYALNAHKIAGNREIAHAGSFGLAHQIYESLHSVLNVGGSYSSSDLGRTYVLNGGLGFDYTKKIPGGHLGLRFNPRVDLFDENTRQGIVATAGETHTFDLVTPIRIDNPLVRNDTIVVTDPNTGIPFDPTDYTLQANGDFTELSVTPFSLLDPSVSPKITTVELAYEYESQPPRRVLSQTRSVGASLFLFDHFTFDASHTRTEQDLRKGLENDATIASSERIRITADSRFKHNQTHFEFDREHSSITPQDRFLFTHDMIYRPYRSLSWGLGFSYSHTRITDTKSVSSAIAGQGNLITRLPYGILARLRISLRQVSQETQDTLGLGSELSFTYHIGRLRFALEGRFDWNNAKGKTLVRQTTSEFSHDWIFRIRRPF